MAFLFLGCSSEPEKDWSCLHGLCYEGRVDNCENVPGCTYESEVWCFVANNAGTENIDHECRIDAKTCQLGIAYYLDVTPGATIVDRCMKLE